LTLSTQAQVFTFRRMLAEQLHEQIREVALGV